MVTMSDIAKAAGVSRLTVSSVLNGDRKVCVGEATRKRILEISAKMNYRPNVLASAVRTGTVNMIGVIGRFTGSHGMKMISGIVGAADRRGYSCKFCYATDFSDIPEAIGSCLEYRVRGIVCRGIFPPECESIRGELEKEKIPLVLLDLSASYDWCSSVLSDDFGGGLSAAEFLKKNGLRRILYAMHRNQDGTPLAQRRLHGFEAGLGRKLDPSEYLPFAENAVMDESENAFLSSRIREARPDAIFCDNDYLALKIYTLLGRMNLRIPGDVSVLGFAGLEFSGIMNPPLTTVRQPFREMGEAAVEELHGLFSGKKINRVELPTELILRESVRKKEKGG